MGGHRAELLQSEPEMKEDQQLTTHCLAEFRNKWESKTQRSKYWLYPDDSTQVVPGWGLQVRSVSPLHEPSRAPGQLFLLFACSSNCQLLEPVHRGRSKGFLLSEHAPGLSPIFLWAHGHHLLSASLRPPTGGGTPPSSANPRTPQHQGGPHNTPSLPCTTDLYRSMVCMRCPESIGPQ